MIDPIRYISNSSSGKQGYAIAECAKKAGWHTTLISGPVHIPKINCDAFIPVVSCDDMFSACINELPVDVAIFAAAVTDWKPAFHPMKIKKDQLKSINVDVNIDILKYIGTSPTIRPKFVVGFSLESKDLISNTKRKLLEKNCDMIVANHHMVDDKNCVFGSDYNKVTIITLNKCESFEVCSKKEIAQLIIEYVSKVV